MPDAPVIEEVATLNTKCQPHSVFRQGEDISISLTIVSPRNIAFDAAVVIENDRDQSLFTTHLTDCRGAVTKNGRSLLTVTVKPPLLRRGRYKVSLAVYSPDKYDYFDVIHHYPLFEIAGTVDRSFPDDIRWGNIFLKLPWIVD
jgi:hypothetical protein